MTDLLAIGTFPRVCFPLLDSLREREPDQASRIEDVYSFVLTGIEDDAIKDWEMVSWLFTAIQEAFSTVAPQGLRFGRRGNVWSFWPDDCQ